MVNPRAFASGYDANQALDEALRRSGAELMVHEQLARAELPEWLLPRGTEGEAPPRRKKSDVLAATWGMHGGEGEAAPGRGEVSG